MKIVQDKQSWTRNNCISTSFELNVNFRTVRVKYRKIVNKIILKFNAKALIIAF